MNFRTEINIPAQENTLSYADRFFSVGSCFSEHMAKRLSDLKFNSAVNPLGTLFNPVSICKSIEFLNGKSPDFNSIIQSSDGVFLHPDFHSSFRSLEKASLKKNISSTLSTLSESFKRSSVLILTLGTAYVYKRVADEEIVANCHKIPQKAFKKELLSVEKITADFKGILPYLKQFKQIILTVSPVRHIKDGIAENQLSKSILRVAASELEKMDKRFVYFPSYEIFMDDLRDYRFYGPDLIHPNQQGIDYTFHKFVKTFFSAETETLMQEVASVQKSLQHKAFNSKSESHRKFLFSVLKKMQSLPADIDFSIEKKELSKTLENL